MVTVTAPLSLVEQSHFRVVVPSGEETVGDTVISEWELLQSHKRIHPHVRNLREVLGELVKHQIMGHRVEMAQGKHTWTSFDALAYTLDQVAVA